MANAVRRESLSVKNWYLRLFFAALLASCTSIVSAETIAYWRFGDQGLTDSSGNGHTLVNANVDLDSSGAAVFNGTDALLKTADTLDLSGYDKLTVECWLKPETPDGDYAPVFLSRNEGGTTSGGGTFVVYFQKGNHTLSSQLRDQPGGWTISRTSATSGIPYQDGWHHLALVMDISGAKSGQDKSKLYVDGVLQSGLSAQTTATVNRFLNTKFIIGEGGDYCTGFFKGMIDDVRITSGCLEPSEFLKFPTYGKKQSPESPVFAHWPFGRSGVADVTGNGWDFTDQRGVSFANDCVSFSGSSSGLFVNKAFNVNPFSRSGLTYEFFFKTTNDKGTDFAMLLENSGNYGSASGRLHARLLENANGKLNVSLKTKGGYNTKLSDSDGADASAIDGEWHHVAIVYDPKADAATQFVTYLDGRALANKEESTATDFSDLDGGCSLFVGCRGMYTYSFAGEMDDVRVMPWALKPAEFLKERSADAPVAHWKFDTAETALTDLSGNGHTLVNMNGVTFQDGYASFNGRNAHLKTLDTIDLSQDSQMTIEGHFWFEETSDIGILFDNGDTSPVGGFVVYGYNNYLYSQFRVTESTTWNQWQWAGFPSSKGSWRHVAFVVNLGNRNKNQSQLWVDGTLVENKLGNWNSSATRLLNDMLAIGGGGSYGDSAWTDHGTSFKGRISELMVTPQELTPENFRLLNLRNPGEVIVRPSAYPVESVALDLADKTDLTVECFAKFPSVGAAGELFAFAPEGAPQFQLAVTDGVLAAKVVPGTGGVNVETADVPTDGDWHHVALVVDSYATGTSRVRLYVDGVRSATHLERVNWSVPFTAGTLEIGSGFNGEVSSVRVTTGVVAPADFLSKRSQGLVIFFR